MFSTTHAVHADLFVSFGLVAFEFLVDSSLVAAVCWALPFWAAVVSGFADEFETGCSEDSFASFAFQLIVSVAEAYQRAQD